MHNVERMDGSLPTLAGMVSTTVFAGSVLPMLVKAARTHEVTSYSLANLTLANIGNAVHSVYVFHLPPGPIWFLHSFYVVSSALMLYWYLRYRPCAEICRSRREAAGSVDPSRPVGAGGSRTRTASNPETQSGPVSLMWGNGA